MKIQIVPFWAEIVVYCEGFGEMDNVPANFVASNGVIIDFASHNRLTITGGEVRLVLSTLNKDSTPYVYRTIHDRVDAEYKLIQDAVKELMEAIIGGLEE